MPHNSMPVSGGAGAPETDPTEEPLSPRQSPLASLFTKGPIVNIYVGPDRSLFQITRELLADRSPWFAAKLQKRTFGARSTLDLQSIDANGFEIAIDWLYSGILPDYIMELDLGDRDWKVNMMAGYATAVTLEIPQLQNNLINHIIERHERHQKYYGPQKLQDCARFNLLNTLYYKYVMQDAVRTFVVTDSSDEDCAIWIDALMSFPHILKDFIMQVNRFNAKPWPRVTLENACNFHIHEDGEQCPSKLNRPILPPRPQHRKGAMLSTTELSKSTSLNTTTTSGIPSV